MTTRRICAGVIAVLMFSVSSMAAACDLSCTFARSQSDCHAQGANHPSSADASLRMDGMAMDGMAMPEMAGGEGQIAVSAKAERTPGHPSISDMGPCERQSCDSASAVSARSARTAAVDFHLILALVEAPLAARASPVFHDARDDLATTLPRDGSPLLVSLRI